MFSLAIHGGAGTLLKEKITPEEENSIHSSLRNALYAGYNILKQGGKSVDAVQAAIKTMEDDPLFNAGHGSVYTNKGDHEMDASIMCGETKLAGAVSAVRHIKNPIELARSILDEGRFIMLTGEGAEEYALMKGMKLVPNTYFSTPFRYEQFVKAKEQDIITLDHSDDKFGTVGAVALDVNGNLSAGTSTGGLTNKVFGRVGDSSIIGAGTYAKNETCAVSCTGKGEFFIKNVVAYDISCQLEYNKMNLGEAANKIVQEFDKEDGGSGGFIAIDTSGTIEMRFNTIGMYRGFIKGTDEKFHVGIFRDELHVYETV
jgi:beta-aspartyl-peptidase (threonine type)